MSGPDKIVGFPDVKHAEQVAAEWLMRMEDGEESAEQRLAFQQWLSASELHVQAFRRLAELWGALDQLEELKDYMAAADLVEVRANKPSRRGLLAMAASFVVAGAGGVIVLQSLDKEAVYEEQFATHLGEIRTINLPDGSDIELNTASSVSIRFDNNARVIQLWSGEAYFDVAKDVARPFSVETNAGSVKAVGTAFSVRLDESEVDVMVRNGRVQLFSAPSTARDSSDRTVRIPGSALGEIAAGQRARFQKEVHQIESVPVRALDQKLAWRNGMLAFTGDPLGDVVSEMSRYTHVSIEVEDAALAAMPITGYFRTGEVDAMLDAFELVGGIKVERINDEHVRLVLLVDE